MAYVYQHIRLDTKEVFYIGISKDKNYQRAYSIDSRNKWWKNIVNKTEFKVKILKDNLSFKDAKYYETQYIKYYGRKDLNEGTLVNLTDGGEGLRNVSPEIKSHYKNLYTGKTFIERYGKIKAKEIGNKITKANIGKKRTDEFKSKQSVRMAGNRNGMFGKTYEEIYGKERAKQIKEEKRQRMLKNNPGKNKTDETKQKMSEAKRGSIPWNKGKQRKQITCPHCGKRGGNGMMQRWHFNNCKKNLTLTN